MLVLKHLGHLCSKRHMARCALQLHFCMVHTVMHARVSCEALSSHPLR